MEGRRRGPHVFNVEIQVVPCATAGPDECESSFDKARVCLTQAGEASSEKGGRRRRRCGGSWGSLGSFLSRQGLNGWEKGRAEEEKNGRGGSKEKGGGGVTAEGLTALASTA